MMARTPPDAGMCFCCTWNHEAVNAKVLKDIKFPVMLDMFDMCSKELQDKLRPVRSDFKAYEDWLVDQVRPSHHI